jgi:hypothetical protein
MSDADPARRRWFTLVAARLTGVAGAVFGLILTARAQDWPGKLLGAAIVLSALLVIAVVPLSLARRWRTPPRP